jgi:hypothetical protein
MAKFAGAPPRACVWTSRLTGSVAHCSLQGLSHARQRPMMALNLSRIELRVLGT